MKFWDNTAQAYHQGRQTMVRDLYGGIGSGPSVLSLLRSKDLAARSADRETRAFWLGYVRALRDWDGATIPRYEVFNASRPA